MVLALRLTSRGVNLDISHEFINTITRYHIRNLAESKYLYLDDDYEYVKSKALENVHIISAVSSTGIEHVVNRVVYCATGTKIYISAG
jgi:hypothetical protein